MLGAQSAREGELLGRESYSGERHPLAQRGACKRESLDTSGRVEEVGEHTLLRPQQVPFLYVFLLQSIPLLCHLALC
jgi:hypothetical protein